MIKENVKALLAELPEGVHLEAACKGRNVEEILEAIEGGVKIIGENYVQEAEAAFNIIGRTARWHFIGHLQKNKLKRALRIFDMIETLDSLGLAEEMDKLASKEGKVVEVLIEVNSGREPQKSGVFPDKVEDFIMKVAGFQRIKIMGLMTMGPVVSSPEKIRPYFSETRRIFERIKNNLKLPNLEMKYLSMGMSDTYKIAVEEGANIVRIGTLIFGPRQNRKGVSCGRL